MRPATEGEALTELTRLFVKSLRSMADAGQAEEACRIAAEGYARLRHIAPREAERLNGVMHYLTDVAGKPKQQLQRGDQ